MMTNLKFQNWITKTLHIKIQCDKKNVFSASTKFGLYCFKFPEFFFFYEKKKLDDILLFYQKSAPYSVRNIKKQTMMEIRKEKSAY